jgi:hypothetical protein
MRFDRITLWRGVRQWLFPMLTLHQPASVDGLLKIVATPFLAAGSWSSM